MRLGNILMQCGGVAETGRPVRFQIRQRSKAGVVRKWCEATILPLSEDERSAAVAAARAHCQANPDASAIVEEGLQLAQRFLVDCDDNTVKWALTDELPKLRAGLTADQVLWLVDQYKIHISEEYPELSPPSTKEELEQQIALLKKRLDALTEEALGESEPAQD